MRQLQFWSEDRRFGLRVDAEHLQRLLAFCREAGSRETGGILLGIYSEPHDMAVVTEVSGPPPDSARGRTWFRRGVQGLQDRINVLWKDKRHFYLGEWHFHPGAAPNPSPDDIAQMREIAASPRYTCPEPDLLIIGGDPLGGWVPRAFVFPRGTPPVELLREEAPTASTHE